MSSKSVADEQSPEVNIEALENKFNEKIAELKAVADECIVKARGWQYEALRWRNMVFNAPTHVAAALFDDEYASKLEELAKQEALNSHPTISEADGLIGNIAQ